LKDHEPTAQSLKIQLQYLEIRRQSPDFERAFEAAAKARANALITVSNSFINSYRILIVELAIKKQMPSMFAVSGWVEAGGLMSYSSNDVETFRRAAKPADLPIEQPTKFELVINLKTAKQIGLTIPPNVLARANRVIR
jgi:putative ABC transport system substrate-binding protein